MSAGYTDVVDKTHGIDFANWSKSTILERFCCDEGGCGRHYILFDSEVDKDEQFVLLMRFSLNVKTKDGKDATTSSELSSFERRTATVQSIFFT